MTFETVKGIENAILEHLQKEELILESEMMGDWAIVIHLENFNSDASEPHNYNIINSRETMAPHVQVGLFSEALDAWRGSGE